MRPTSIASLASLASPSSLALLGVLALFAAACAAGDANRPQDPPGSGKSPALSLVADRSQPPPPKPAEPQLDVVRLQADHPWVAVRVQFRAGGSDDPPGKEGLTALCAQVMAQGGTQALSASELQEKLFPWAAELDAQTDQEQTTFVGRAHADHAALFEPIFTDVLVAPRWELKEFERLRRSALDALTLRLRSSDDEELGKQTLQLMLYEGHPYGHVVGGTVEGLKTVTLDDCKAHAARVFTRARMVVGFAGKADDALVDRVKKKLATLPQGEGKPSIPAATPSKTRLLVVEKPSSKSTAISLGFPIELKRGDPEFFALWLATSAFGEHRQFGGRLMEDLRGVRGLNYGDYAYVEHFAQEGWGTLPLPNVARSRQYYSLWLRPVEPAHRLFALRAALWELDRFAKQGLSAEELAKTKDFLKGYTLLFDQTDSRRLGFALDEKFYGSAKHLEGFRQALDKLTLDEVNAAIRKHVRPDQVRIAVVTPDAAGYADAVKSGAPTPIRYEAKKPDAVLQQDKQIEAFPFGIPAEEIRVVKADGLFEK